MEITELEMYLITRMTPISLLLEAVFATSIVSTTFLYVMYLMSKADDCFDAPWLKTALKRFALAALVSGILSMAIPDTREMAAIKVLPAISRNTEIKSSAKALVDIATKYMAKQTGELSEGEGQN